MNDQSKETVQQFRDDFGPDLSRLYPWLFGTAEGGEPHGAAQGEEAASVDRVRD